MLSFQNSKVPKLPSGFIFDLKEPPSPAALNRLLSRCFGESHHPGRLALALKQSYCNASIKDAKAGRLVGFVRITSDKGLNANLWDLAVEPGDYQKQLIAVLVK